MLTLIDAFLTIILCLSAMLAGWLDCFDDTKRGFAKVRREGRLVGAVIIICTLASLGIHHVNDVAHDRELAALVNATDDVERMSQEHAAALAEARSALQTAIGDVNALSDREFTLFAAQHIKEGQVKDAAQQVRYINAYLDDIDSGLEMNCLLALNKSASVNEITASNKQLLQTAHVVLTENLKALAFIRKLEHADSTHFDHLEECIKLLKVHTTALDEKVLNHSEVATLTSNIRRNLKAFRANAEWLAEDAQLNHYRTLRPLLIGHLPNESSSNCTDTQESRREAAAERPNRLD